MKRTFLSIISLGIMAGITGCSDRDEASAETTVPAVPLENFAGRWINQFEDDRARVIDLASDGTYTYEIRTGHLGSGDVVQSAQGKYEVTDGGDIAGEDDVGQSPAWTATRTGGTMTFSFQGSEGVTFRNFDIRGQ